MITVVLFSKDHCPWCAQFSEIWERLRKHNWGPVAIEFVKIEATHPIAQEMLDKAAPRGQTYRQKWRVVTVPHILLIDSRGAEYIWNGGQEPRTFENLVKFIQGDLTYAAKTN